MEVLGAMAGARHGGAEAFFVRLTRALAARGIARCVAVRSFPERDAALAAAGVAVRAHRFGGAFDRATVPRLAALLDELRPDVAMSWMSRASRAVSRARRRSRARGLQIGRLGGYYNLKYYRGCDHLVVNTPDLLRYVAAAGWPEERADYVPNFVDAAPMPAVPRAAFDTPDSAPLLLALGRLHPNKGFDVLLAALTGLPQAWLWIAGDGPLAAALSAQARRIGVSGRVRFLGWREDAPALLAAADVLVCPSRREPLGNVVLEGWAHGAPVVACAAAGPAGLIDDGETGLLAPVDDAPALAAAVSRALAPETAARLAEAGAAAFRESYTEQAVTDRYVALFERLIRSAAS